MLVSGGKIIAIDGVNTTSATLSGDGVFTPLGVNTDNVATKKFVTDNLNTVSSKLTNTDNYLSAAIDYVSANAGKTYKPGAGIEIDNNNVVSISSDYIDAITSVSAIKGTIISGDSNFNITSANSGNNILWNLELTSQPVVTDTTLSGYNGIIARKDSTVSSQWNVGLDGTYKSAIEQVSGKLDKSDSAKFYPITNPSGFITGIPTSSNWDSVYSTVNTNSGTWKDVTSKADQTDLETLSSNVEHISADVETISSNLDNKLNKNDFTAWSANIDTAFYSAGEGLALNNHTFSISAKYLSANALDNLSGNWNSVYDTVSSNSANWNNLTAINTFSSIGGVSARNSADELLFEPGDNVSITTANNTITFSAKDTTYDENDFISASHLDNIGSVSSNVTSNSADWTSAARALEASADKWNTTHEQFNTSSVKWNELYDEYQVSSKLWNDTTDAVNTFSGDWNEVSAKANSDDLEELSGKVKTLSGELKTASAFIEDQIDVLSGAIDGINYDLNFISGTVDKKLDISAFDSYSANVSAEFSATSAWALDTFFKTSEYFYAVSGTDSSSEYFNWSGDTLSASWKVKHFNLSFNYAVKPVSACPDFIYRSQMQVGNTIIDDRHYIEGYSDTVNYNVSYNIYNADNKTYKFTFSADDKLNLENLHISCIGFINPRTLNGNLGFVEDGTSGNFVDSQGNKFIFVEKLPVG